jgi:hypothetical protein
MPHKGKMAATSVRGRQTTFDLSRKRRADIADLLLKGYNAYQIGRALKIDSNTVRHHVRVLREEWVNDPHSEYAIARNGQISQALRELDNLKREAWIAWEHSIREKVYHSYDYSFDGDFADFQEAHPLAKTFAVDFRKTPHIPKLESSHIEERELDDGSKVKVKVTRRTEEMLGDPRYLQIVSWCIDRKIKMLGLDAPTKVQGDITLWQAALIVAEEEGVDPGELAALYEMQRAKQLALQSGNSDR